MKKILFIFTFIFAFQIKSQAGILLEPYVGYNALVSDYAFGSGAGVLNGQSFKLDSTGLGYGARLGYSFAMVFVAFDYSSTTLKSTVKTQPTGATITVTGDDTPTEMAGVVGANFGFLRPFVGYVFDVQSKNSNTTTFGNGYKAGLGFSLLPKVKLNLEYKMFTFTKSKTGSTETTFGASQTYKSVTSSGFFVNVSFPFMF